MLVLEHFISKNLPQRYNLEAVNNLILDLLDEDDKVIYYISSRKKMNLILSSQIFFTKSKLIIAQRQENEWGGDIHLPYEEINRLSFTQNKLFFKKLDLMGKLDRITFYVNKDESHEFNRLISEIREMIRKDY